MIKLEELMNLMNYNLHTRKNGNNSMLGEIQIAVSEVFCNSNPSLEQQSMFKANLVGNPNMFDDPSKYASVSSVYATYAEHEMAMTVNHKTM